MAGVLIVDDSLTIRMDLKQALEAAGYATTLSASIAAAHQELAGGSFGLVILDLLLPDGDGLELLHEIRSDPRTAAIPVMLLSTETEVHHRLRGLLHAVPMTTSASPMIVTTSSPRPANSWNSTIVR